MQLNKNALSAVMIFAETLDFEKRQTVLNFLESEELQQFSPEDIRNSIKILSDEGYLDFEVFKALGTNNLDGFIRGINYSGYTLIESIKSGRPLEL